MKKYNKLLTTFTILIIPQLILSINSLKQSNSFFITVNMIFLLAYLIKFIKNTIKKCDMTLRDYYYFFILSSLQTTFYIGFVLNEVTAKKIVFNTNFNIIIQIILTISILYGVGGILICKKKEGKELSKKLEAIIIISSLIFAYILYGIITAFDNTTIILVQFDIFIKVICYGNLLLTVKLFSNTFVRNGEINSLVKFIVVIAIPIFGLYLNMGFEYVFGDFSNILYYVIPIINSVILIPKKYIDEYSGFIFFILSFTYPYTVYFFIIFLQDYPYAPYFIIFIGVGLLIMGPLFLLLMHTYYLVKIYKQIKNKILIPVFIIGFSIIPISLTMDFYEDRDNYKLAVKTIDVYYIDSAVNLNRLDRSVKKLVPKEIGSLKKDAPIITPYYESIVFKDISMSDEEFFNMKSYLRHKGYLKGTYFDYEKDR